MVEKADYGKLELTPSKTLPAIDQVGTHSMLRGPGSQRSERTSVDTGTGEKRIAGPERGAHIKRGMFVNEQKDLGLNTTEAHAKNIRAEEKAFQGQVKQQQSAIGKAEGEYNAAMGQVQKAYDEINAAKIPSPLKVVEDAWNKQAASYVPVRFVNKDQILETVYMPLEAAQKYQGHAGIWATPVDGGKFFNVEAKSSSDTIKMATMAKKSMEGARSDYIAKNLPIAQKAYSQSVASRNETIAQVKAKEDEFNAAAVGIASAKGELASAKAKRDAMWEEARGSQEKRIATMAQILGNFKVG